MSRLDVYMLAVLGTIILIWGNPFIGTILVGLAVFSLIKWDHFQRLKQFTKFMWTILKRQLNLL